MQADRQALDWAFSQHGEAWYSALPCESAYGFEYASQPFLMGLTRPPNSVLCQGYHSQDHLLGEVMSTERCTGRSVEDSFLRYSFPGNESGVAPILGTSPIRSAILGDIDGASVTKYNPTTHELLEAVDQLPEYGFIPRSLIRPDTNLYSFLVAHAAFQPLAVYATAGHHNIFSLAQEASSHLLTFPLNQIDDHSATRMGPTYLKHLFLLHLNRLETAKGLLLQPPQFHPGTEKCNFASQNQAKRAWALGTSQLAWAIRAGRALLYFIASHVVPDDPLLPGTVRPFQPDCQEHIPTASDRA